MTIALPDFIAELTQNPALLITVVLTFGSDFGQRLDRRPQRHCHLCFHQKHGGAPRDYYGGGAQFSGRFG